MKKFLPFVMVSSFAVLLSGESFAQDIALNMEMNVGENFSATSKALKGTARKTGEVVTADRLVLPLNTLKTGLSMRDGHMLKYFKADKHPEAVMTEVKGKDGNFTGKLSLAGVQKPVDIEGEYKIEAGKVKANFKTSIEKYGIEKPKYAGVGVEDEVNVEATIPLAK